MKSDGDRVITGRNTNEAFLEIVYIFIAPVALLYVGVIPYSWRILVLLGISLLIMSIIRYGRWTRAQLGIAHLFRPRATAAWSFFTLLGVVAIVYYARRFDFDPVVLGDLASSWRLLLFFIPLSVLQEVAYRGFLTERLRQFSFSRFHRVFLNAALFTLLHIIYPYAAITLPIAFIGGLCFAALYEKHPDLLLACMSHSVLNFTAVYFGFFS